ncbi:PREDICTED: cytochrome P450 CYP12A2-like [Vollenhovia emeryi]|uniref:cytochrome P450 CYP12A2-like n=1 Tax=Vollenhovia emeryi TaxID=411798 RepID=UPI0005F47002|nr:PREDICTED: cytochrome P450 CYP12A2-like [Vollenhovia emeryi]
MRVLRDKYGNIVKLDGIGKEQSMIYLFCPELCKDMYQLQGKWPTRNSLEPLHCYRQSREHIYNGQYGLVTRSDSHWKRCSQARRILSQGELWSNFRSKVAPHMIRPEIVKIYSTYIDEITSDLVENMRMVRDPETLELPHDFINELYKWSLESMCSIALNCRLGCLKSDLTMDSEPQIMINSVREVFDLIYLLENTPSVFQQINTRNLERLFCILDTINEISERYVEEATMKCMEATNNTNLDNYSKLQKFVPETKFLDNTKLENRSILEKLLRIDKQIANVMALDIIMSTDTTSNAAAALLYCMAINREKQETLRKEVMSVLPDEATPVTYDILNKIPYTKSCIKESLRLFPITNGTLRTMQKDVSIGGYMIPKGADVIACHALLSMDPAYFSQPNSFIPERWIRGTSEYSSYKQSHPYAYMPFGFGVRTCIGRKFAEMKLKIVLLKVIRNFRIEWHYGPLEYKSQVTNTVTSPLRLKLSNL